MAEQNFFLESIDFGDILEDARIDGEEIGIARSVELTLESPDSDGPISLDAIWPTLRSRSGTPSPGASGIVDDFEDGFAFQLRSVAAFQGGNDGVGVKLTGINSEVSEEDELFLVFEYHEDLEDFINFDYPIRLRSENPIADDTVFLRPFTSSDVQLSEVKENLSRPPATEEPTRVPESDPVLGLVLIGIIGVGLLLKRK